MSKNLAVIIIFLNFVSAQSELKVVTFNTMGMKPNTEWQIRLKNTINQLIDLNPDVIGLQEINEYVKNSEINNIGELIMDSLRAHFGFNYQMVFQKTHVSWEIHTEGIAIISKYPIIGTDFLDLTPGVFNRKIIGCLINSSIGKINIFTTHLSYRKEHDNIRLKQVKEIKKFIKGKEIEWSNNHSIVTGDFNSTPESHPIKEMLQELNKTNFFEPQCLENYFTFPSNSPYKKIDYIFINKESKLKCVKGSVIINKPDQQNRFPSDHIGLMAIIK